MRGLTNEERDHLEAALNLAPSIDACLELGPKEMAIIDRLVQRGLIVWVPRFDGVEEWDETYATPAGRIALECDSAARTGWRP